MAALIISYQLLVTMNEVASIHLIVCLLFYLSVKRCIWIVVITIV